MPTQLNENPHFRFWTPERLPTSDWYLGVAISPSMAWVIFCAAQYAEILIQMVYVVLISTTAFIFKELEERLKKISSNSHCSPLDFPGLSKELENWNRHYDLTCRLIEEINECFNPILLITIGYLFITSSTSASEIVRGRSMLTFKGPDEEPYYLNTVAIIKAGQVLLRLVIFLTPTVLLKDKVFNSNAIFLFFFALIDGFPLFKLYFHSWME